MITIGTGSTKSVTTGNPLIDPFRAKTYDVSVEWYFMPQSLLSAAYFYKDISTFVQTYQSPLSTFAANPFREWRLISGPHGDVRLFEIPPRRAIDYVNAKSEQKTRESQAVLLPARKNLGRHRPGVAVETKTLND